MQQYFEIEVGINKTDHWRFSVKKSNGFKTKYHRTFVDGLFFDLNMEVDPHLFGVTGSFLHSVLFKIFQSLDSLYPCDEQVTLTG